MSLVLEPPGRIYATSVLTLENCRRSMECFGDIFRMPYTFHSLPNAIAIWMTKAKSLSRFDMCKTATAEHILKEIWNSRCRALFQGERMQARRIAIRVMQHIQMTAFIYSSPKINTRMQEHVLGIMGIPPRQPRMKRVIWCCWNNPGWYKLNFDGRQRRISHPGVV